MGVAVDRRTAGVHPKPVAVGRLDGLDGASQGVAEVEGHAKFVAFAEVRAEQRPDATISPRIALTFPSAHRYRDRGLA
jgi:hypothetical protein